MKRILCLLMVLLLPFGAIGEGVVYNRTGELEEEYVFPEGTPLLEIVFPRVYSSDCAVLRFGDEVMMIDASMDSELMQGRIKSALDSMGVDHIDTAFNTHPHNDHITGFHGIHEYAPLGQLYIAFPEDYDARMKKMVKFCNEQNIPILHAQDGDVLTMGENGEVTLTIMQRWGRSDWGANDQSAMLLIRYGERSILFASDIEDRAQKEYAKNPPACGLDADILKHPHHGIQALWHEFRKAVDPELVFINGASNVMDLSKAELERRKIPYLIGYKGLTRMRTDGAIWVVDYIYEVAPDRETINPVYTGVTDIP